MADPLTYTQERGADPLQQYQACDQDFYDLIAAAQQATQRATQLPQKVSTQQLKDIADALLDSGDHDANLLEHLGKLLKVHSIDLPAVTVEFRNVSIKTNALIGSAAVATVGNSLTNFFQRAVGRKQPTKELQILRNVSGVLQPGRATLLLGPPGSGKSTFLKLISGRLETRGTLQVEGDVQYNGHHANEFELRRTAAFVQQHDFHIPNLTVDETLKFAFTCQSGKSVTDFDIDAEVKRIREMVPSMGQDQDAVQAKVEQLLIASWRTGVRVEIILRMLGLVRCRNTVVGDAWTRGVSGGERKRVTTGEMVVGPRRMMMLDEISTGLDSATLFSVISFFVSITRNLELNTVISLLQPPPEVFFLFDDVILMTDGRVLYHGPVKGAASFMASIGFECPPRKDLPSFLLEVTTAAGQRSYGSQQVLARKPDTASCLAGEEPLLMPLDEFAERFWSDTVPGKEMAEKLQGSYPRDSCHVAALEKKPFAMKPLQAMKVTTAQQISLVLRDKVLLKGRIVQVIIVGLLTGSLFYNIASQSNLNDARSVLGASFLCTLFMGMSAMPQLAIVLEHKKIWIKHMSNRFYPSYARAVSLALSTLPLSLGDALLFSVIVYWMMGFYPSAGRFFTFYLVMTLTSMCFGSIFRLIGMLAPDATSTNTYASLYLLIMLLTSGFSITYDSIPPWWVWAYYISPFSYSLRSIALNELLAPSWQEPAPFDPSVTLGVYALEEFDFFTDPTWIWWGVLFLVGCYLVATALSVTALARMREPRTVARVADEEELKRARVALAKEREQSAGGGASDVTQQADTSKASGVATVGSADVEKQATGTLSAAAITLVWRDLCYFVPNPALAEGKKALKKKLRKDASDTTDVEVGKAQVPTELQLLHSIAGEAQPGVLTALMGGSGAGKTTLMDVICGRKTVGRITGDIMVNGHPKDQRSWSRSVGYCEQFDVHTAAQLVVEALWFSARLRLPKSVTDAQVRAYVAEVLELVGLTSQQFELVGEPGAGNGLSVEARKRLTIAVELVANPSVVFMDEPTSGLDARAAVLVMRAVRNVARNGRTVMVTIHQPSIDIFEAFDMLLLLQRGGRTTYFGPIGVDSRDLVAYLEAVPGTAPLVPGYNPSTWMLEVTGGSMANTVTANTVDWPALWADSAENRALLERCDRLVSEGASAGSAVSYTGRYAQPFLRQVAELLKKMTLAYWRIPSYNLVRMLVTLGVSIIFGTTYLNQGKLPSPATVSNVQNLLGIMFSSTNFLGMSNMMSVLSLTGAERVVFYRERGASTYEPFAMGIANALVELPYLIIQAILFVPIMYFLVGFQIGSAAFFYYLLMFLLGLTFYTVFGQFLAYVTPNQQLAQVVGAGLNFIFNIFNGFVIPYPSIPVYWQWLNRLVPTTWVLYGLGAAQLGNVSTPLTFGGQQVPVSEFVQQQFGYSYDFRWFCVLIMFGYVLFFRVSAVLALKYWNFLRR